MKRTKKLRILSLSIAFFFSFQTVASFCCCLEISAGETQLPSTEPCHQANQEHSRDTQHRHSANDCSCDHWQKIADLAGEEFPAVFVRLFSAEFPVAMSAVTNNHVDRTANIFPDLDIGPPGLGFSSSPLYLQISSLRI